MNKYINAILIFAAIIISLFAVWLFIMWGPKADTKDLSEYPKEEQIYIKSALKNLYGGPSSLLSNGTVATVEKAMKCEDGSLEYMVSFRQYNFLHQKVWHSGSGRNCDGSMYGNYGGIYLYPNQK